MNLDVCFDAPHQQGQRGSGERVIRILELEVPSGATLSQLCSCRIRKQASTSIIRKPRRKGRI
jgi:hypothetical protein